MSASLNEPTTSIAPLSAIASCRMRADVDHYLVSSAHITGALRASANPCSYIVLTPLVALPWAHVVAISGEAGV
jgi:hypothetical protein